MQTKTLHIELNPEHPVFQWVNAQADQVGARGHVGTHLDCYTQVPEVADFTTPAYLLDCRNGMPDTAAFHNLPDLTGKALFLYTGNMEQHEYGTPEYMRFACYLTFDSLAALLEKQPKFILIDSHGIGSPGKEHGEMDRLCEQQGCHVIENIDLSADIPTEIPEVHISIDKDHPSTGKPCRVQITY